MNTSNKPLVAALVIAVVAFLVLPPLAIYSLDSKQDEETRNNTVAGCERTNAIRNAEFTNAVLDALTREAAAKQYTAEAREAILRYASLNWAQAQEVVDAAAEFPKQSWPETGSEKVIADLAHDHLQNPGPPEVDCEGAF